jgi:hypothetical protein
MVRSKECFKCKTVKPLEDFYKHPAMLDGHVNKCKVCNKKDVGDHREKNLEKIRAYDRERGKNADRIASTVAVVKAWRAEDGRRTKAQRAVAYAIRTAKLVRQPCVRCGNPKSHAHHESYDYPLEVMWLCPPCHKQRHKELKEEF